MDTPSKTPSAKDKKRPSESLVAQCLVCSSPAAVHTHYGAVSCYPCRAFFRRGVSQTFICVSKLNMCRVDNITRGNCKKCRFERCLAVGMKPELVNNRVKRKEREKIMVTMEEIPKEDYKNKDNEIEQVTESEDGTNQILCTNRTNELLHTAQSDTNFTAENEICKDNHDTPDYKEREETNKVSVIKRHVTDHMEGIQIDIDSLVDTCFAQELGHIKSITLPFKKRRSAHGFEFITLAITNDQTLNAHFTFEEEFRLHDLIVRRDHLDEEKLKYMLNKGPMIVNAVWKQTALCIKTKGKITAPEMYSDFMQECSRDLTSSTYKDIFNEFRSLDNKTAQSCVYNSFPSAYCLMIAMLDSTKHTGLRNQTLFFGYSGQKYQELWDIYFPNMEHHEGIGIEDLAMFISPWARTLDDEIFFRNTCAEVAQVLGPDLKLYVVFLTLLISSQPENSPLLQNTSLRQLQVDLSLLLYRYLTTKYDRDEAAKQAHSLIGLLDKLHRCGNIFMNKRIRML